MEKDEEATGYVVLVKEVPEEWSEAKRHEFDSDVTTTEVDGLSPTCTFQVKLIVKSASGESEPSDESVVDTLVANCGPDQDKKKVLSDFVGVLEVTQYFYFRLLPLGSKAL